MTDKSAWIAYLLGAFLTVAGKWALWCYHGCKMGKSIRESSGQWFFESSTENAVSWTATIGGVWLLGSIYIDRAIIITGLSSLPVIDSLAFLLGSLMEFTAPAVVKWVISKLPLQQPIQKD